MSANQQLPPSRVLITGAAGFLGFHTATALSAQPSTFILGLDNFNSALYSAQLKQQREALLLSCCNVTIEHGDIRSTSLLQHLFGCYNFTQVVHLAAQAGVRLSVQQPAQYVANNVEGTVHLLEAIRQQHPPASLVYASSSLSVECRSVLPSKECYVLCGKPTSVYAASKRATEEMVAVYNHQYGIAATGLRFFTVYGPYGRPDMAVAKLAAGLACGVPINITCFKIPAAAATHHTIRDFTAVSDVVQGIQAACKATAANAAHAQSERQAQNSPSHVVYNLGRGQPTSTVLLLHYLEVLLNKQAVSVNFVMPAAANAASVGRGTADVWATWADMTAAKQGLGVEPRMGLRDGLEEFARGSRAVPALRMRHFQIRHNVTQTMQLGRRALSRC
ncbi:hypothetical protein COO60DRAFT_1272153 [Scenedesmus sp. NREL 46B-D3]|nr:hypothetical protein COO60DRAFT_1272153 [Scenedesmus sp. NREL 46B-D3]